MLKYCNNQSIIVFCPRAGLSLQTQHSPLYPLLSILFVSSYSPFIIMLSIIWYLLLPRTFFPFTIPSRASFSRQFLLSQWPSQFIFLFFISVGHVARAARRLATGWTARVRSRVSEGVEIFLHTFVSRVALGSTRPPINWVPGNFPGGKGGRA